MTTKRPWCTFPGCSCVFPMMCGFQICSVYVYTDVFFLHCNTLHRSAANLSDYPRWSYIIAYNAARNDPLWDHHHARYTPLKKVFSPNNCKSMVQAQVINAVTLCSKCCFASVCEVDQFQMIIRGRSDKTEPFKVNNESVVCVVELNCNRTC